MSELTREVKGRIFEAIVGNRLCERFESVYFWREGRDEVDFVVDIGKALYAIEVKTKQRKTSGIATFKRNNKNAKVCYIDFENYIEFEKDPEAFLSEYSL